MRHTIIGLFLLAATLSGLHAQEGERERLKSLKIAFITQRLDLTTEEAQNFWPVYNAFDAREMEIRKKTRSIRKKIRENFDALSDEDAKTLLNDLMTAETAMHQEKMLFYKNVTNVLPARKVILLKAVEDDFKRRMLDEFKRRRGGPRNKNLP